MRPQHQFYDVIVVGARVAGAATAKLLAEQGLRVLTVDRSGYGSDTISTHALLSPGVELLDRWGMVGDIERAGTPAINSTIFHYEGKDPLGFDLTGRPLLAPRRTVLDRLLADHARAAGAEVLFDTRVLDVSRKANGAADGIVVNTDRGAVSLTSRLVIGADGLNSLVARKVGSPVTHRSRHSSASVFGYFDGPFADGYRWHFARSLSAGSIPTNDDLTLVFVSFPAKQFRIMAKHGLTNGFVTKLEATAPNLADLASRSSQNGRLRSFPGKLGFTRKASGPGWALVGDAGAFIDPMTNHGMTAALRDAALCSQAAIRSLQDPSAASEAWAEYESIRDDIDIPMMNLVDKVVAYTNDLDDVQEAHVALARLIKRELDPLSPNYRIEAA